MQEERMSMRKYVLTFDTERCFGCYGCVVACQQEHKLTEDKAFLEIQTIGPVRVDGRMAMRFIPHVCMHCRAPMCIKVCPVKAISKKEEGIVLIDAAKCIGCWDCTWACPYHAIAFDEETGKAMKCDLCIDRLGQGLLPSCVHNCPSKAITLKVGTGPGKLEKGRLSMSDGLVRVVALSHARSAQPSGAP